MDNKDVVKKALRYLKANLDDALEAFGDADIVVDISEDDIDNIYT